MVSRIPDIAHAWRDAFMGGLKRRSIAEPLKKAALAGNLRDWTTLATEQVVASCKDLRWQTAAKGFQLDRLPQKGHEYLGIDAMAFEGDDGASRWVFPVAVFELENSRSDDRIAYSLWKVLCVRARLRVVFAYRVSWEEGVQLVSYLADHVVSAIPQHDRAHLEGTTTLVIGSRAENETFPWGYFRFWVLNLNTGRFERN